MAESKILASVIEPDDQEDDYEESEDDIEDNGPTVSVTSWPPTKPETERLTSILEEMKDGTLDPTPAWQRRPVWSDAKKAALIESVFIGIPLPLFYFAEATAEKGGEEVGIRECVDGQQRLHAMRDFAEGRLATPHHESCPRTSWPGLFRSESRAPDKVQGFGISTATVPMIGAVSKFDLYQRINKDPTPLSPQELRNAAFWEEAEEYLRAVIRAAIDNAELLRVKPGDFTRMRDVELMTRLAAFIRSGPSSFPNKRLQEFLNTETSIGGAAVEGVNMKVFNSVKEGLKRATSVYGDSVFALTACAPREH